MVFSDGLSEPFLSKETKVSVGLTICGMDSAKYRMNVDDR